MQDIHTIGVGGGGRLYGGGGGGDRRLRPHHQTLGGQSPKCPRCDSANTKFCYYNNYNLSQPRHFCKACRRYWTKGGVLRNVPVGGGCRKTKRSSSGTAKPKSTTKSNKSQSSSESSSLTASAVSAAAAAAPAAAAEVASVSAPRIFDFSQGSEPNPSFVPVASSSDPGFVPVTPSSNPSFVPVASSSEIPRGADMFSGSFTSMMMSSSSAMMELSYDQQWTRQPGNVTDEAVAVTTTSMPEELKIAGGFLDPMPQMDLSGRGLDHELFDLSGTVDQTYWNQPQWNDNDHALYLP